MNVTKEMVAAAEEAYMPFGDMEIALKAALAVSHRKTLSNHYKKKGTGRTTRMLEEALKLSSLGRDVCVIVERGAAKYFGRNPKYLRLKFEPAEITAGPAFCWESLRFRGSHQNCEVLIDHYVIERRFSSLLAMYTRFDIQEQP